MYSFKPYPFCVGHKYRKVLQLYRPLVVLFATSICNCHLLDIYKIRFFKQFYRWFLKSTLAFKVKPFLKNGERCKIEECDEIYVSCRVKKALLRKLFSKLKLQISDYKILKNRKYTLIFIFFFCDLKNKDKNIFLDVTTSYRDWFKVFLVLNNVYYHEILQFLLYFYITLNKKK